MNKGLFDLGKFIFGNLIFDALKGWRCARCNYPVDHEDKFCPHCLQPLKWKKEKPKPKTRFIDFYLTWRNYFLKGWTEIGFFKNIVLGLLALKIYGVSIELSVIIMAVVFVFCLVIGFEWDRRGWFHNENDWNFSRQNILKKVKKALK